MKKIGEIVQSQSLTAYEDLGVIATKAEKKTPTPSAGSGTAVSTELTTRLQPEEARDILWKLSTLKPWEIKPGDQKAAQSALSVLAWATIPATNDEALFWLTRLLAHFPRRDTAQDAVVLADLAADMVESKVSLVALVSTCDEVRKAGSRKNPWLPPSGEILKIAEERTRHYELIENRLKNPVALPPPVVADKPKASWDDMPWGIMPDAARSDLWLFLKGLDMEIRRIYCSALKFDYAAIEAWAAENTPQTVEEKVE